MKTRPALSALPLLVALLLPIPAQTPTAPPPAGDADFLRQVRGRILQSQPFRVDFVQRVIVDEEVSLEESGVIVFASRERVKWQYLRPDYKTFILEGGRYSFYDRENKQLLRGSLGERSRELVWEVLFSEQPGQSCRWNSRERTIRVSLAGEGGIEELTIQVGSDFLPRRVEQSAVNDVTTVYEFRNYRPRVALAAGEFALDLPADVEIIEEQAP
ncbi:MAG: outer membrane lipoprotein carrier protein LolA [Acidobacteria bacterium]|jgi:outer membrane lipoprotein-sorting protein|nr:outer membrane lipoprotein carrier protein LolA [Acidobacteriota bacterium]